MKKINAFYCIKTPSDWKESVLMYDKPTEKNKTKLTGFQLAGAVLAALLLVVGGALTLYRSGDEFKVDTAKLSGADSSSTIDSTELTADLEQAQNALKQVVKDKEITAVGMYAGCGSDGTGYLFVDKIYVEKYTSEKGELIDYVTVNEYEYLKYHSYVAFKLDFRAKDVTTGKFAYMDELKVGEKIAVGINCDDLHCRAVVDTLACLCPSEEITVGRAVVAVLRLISRPEQSAENTHVHHSFQVSGHEKSTCKCKCFFYILQRE